MVPEGVGEGVTIPEPGHEEEKAPEGAHPNKTKQLKD